MLKVTNGTNGLRSVNVRSPTAKASSRAPPHPQAPENRLLGLNSTTDAWDAYANGGVQAEDEQSLRLRREQDAELLENFRVGTPPAGPSSTSTKLIQISPEKAPVSKNTSLLVDLGEDIVPTAGQRQSHSEMFSYETAAPKADKGKGKAVMNLLD